MASNNFGDKLKQEFLKSPKKAGLLGMMLLVALYFWAPLVVKLFSPRGTSLASAVVTPIVNPVASTTVSLAAKPAKPWYELVEWMGNDPRKNIPTVNITGRNPFESQYENNKQVINTKVIEKREELVTPEDLGLTLTSTIVSAGRSTASISGKVYRSSQEFNKFYKGRSLTIQLQEVFSRHVLIEIEGNLFKLQIARPASQKVRIYRNE